MSREAEIEQAEREVNATVSALLDGNPEPGVLADRIRQHFDNEHQRFAQDMLEYKSLPPDLSFLYTWIPVWVRRCRRMRPADNAVLV